MIKLLLKSNKKNKSGLVPIYLRITVDRKTSFISTKHYILPKQWDERLEQVKESHPLHEQINLDITNRKKQALENLIHAGVRRKSITAKQVKDKSTHGTNIFLFCDNLKKSLQGKRSDNTLENWDKHLRKLKAFGGDHLRFEDITPDFLADFELWLRGEGVNRRENRDPANYIFAIMKTIRTLFNEARDKKITELYPFDEYEMPEQSIGDKDHLTLSELDKWTKFIETTTNERYKQAAIYFLFGCYSGLRISDWYLFKFNQVHKNYISLRATKNKQWVAIPLHSRLKKVLEMMKKTPLTLKEPELNRYFKIITEQAEINKYISSHSARKSFAVTMCLEMGISSETAAELMGITLAVFVKSYSRVTSEKIRKETAVWNEL